MLTHNNLLLSITRISCHHNLVLHINCLSPFYIISGIPYYQLLQITCLQYTPDTAPTSVVQFHPFSRLQ
jgi:hypothetical protein